MSKKRIFLFIVLGLLLLAVLSAVIVWNKPHRKAEDEKGIPVAAAALYQSFSSNEQAANGQYLNKVLNVTGTISEVSRNQDGQTVAILKAVDPLGGVQCTMREKGVDLKPETQVTLKGFCNGYTMVVLLSDCIIQQ